MIFDVVVGLICVLVVVAVVGIGVEHGVEVVVGVVEFKILLEELFLFLKKNLLNL